MKSYKKTAPGDLVKMLVTWCEPRPLSPSPFSWQIVLALSQSLSEKHLAVEKCRREIMERRRLHRQLAELRGRIRVLVRVRPVIREDGDCRVVAHVDTVDDSQLTVRREQREKVFSVDRAFSISSTQQEVGG